MVANLKDIAEQLEIITLQDSLIRISKLSVKKNVPWPFKLKTETKPNWYNLKLIGKRSEWIGFKWETTAPLTEVWCKTKKTFPV